MKTMNMGLIKALYLFLYLAVVVLLMTGCAQTTDIQAKAADKYMAEELVAANQGEPACSVYLENREDTALPMGGVEYWIGIQK